MSIRHILPSIDVSASGLTAQRKKMNAVASNIANADTTRTEEGGPYRRRTVAMKALGDSMRFSTVMRRTGATLRTTHPDHIPSAHRERNRAEAIAGGVQAEEVVEANSGTRLVYDPSHPDANAEGYVTLPDIDIVTEMVDMITATRAYEANVTAIQAAKDMAKKALEI